MKISGASVLALALVVLCSSSSTTGVLGLDLGNIISGLANLTNPLLGNLTAPILGPSPAAASGNGSVALSGGLNLTNIVSPLNNLTAGGAITGALNLTTVAGPLANATGGVVAGLNPVLNNVTGALNLTSIVGAINNITGPLVDALVNFTGPASNLSLSTNVTVAVSLNLPPATISNLSIAFPSFLTIVPLGLTEVSFTVYTKQGSNATSIPITFMVPVLSYLDFPVSGAAQVTVDFPLGGSLLITGLTNKISRLFFGVSWQTFPQLSSVIISKLLPGGGPPELLYTLAIPALICKAFHTSSADFCLVLNFCLSSSSMINQNGRPLLLQLQTNFVLLA